MIMKELEIEKQIVTTEIKEQLEKLQPEKGLTNVKNFKNKVQWALQNITPQLHFTIGNAKLPKTTLIFNLGTWFNCPGRKEGFCELCEECYDKSPEVRFKDRIKGRLEQEIYFRAISAEKIGEQLTRIITTHNNKKRIKHKIDRIRFNEVGELRNQEDLEKIIKISNIVYENTGVKSYIYTHNKDLNFDIQREALTINGSNFMVDNEYRVVEKGQREQEYQTLNDISNKRDCICDCEKCPNYCLNKSGYILIEEVR